MDKLFFVASGALFLFITLAALTHFLPDDFFSKKDQQASIFQMVQIVTSAFEQCDTACGGSPFLDLQQTSMTILQACRSSCVAMVSQCTYLKNGIQANLALYQSCKSACPSAPANPGITSPEYPMYANAVRLRDACLNGCEQGFNICGGSPVQPRSMNR